jgi:endonuclease/exonuclease/phosphatase (EEP) superfamily protein YafD
MSFAGLLRLLATPVLTLGLVLHLSVADACGVLRAVFYALPWPVLAAGWLIMAFAWKRRRSISVACVVIALACGAWWLGVSRRTPQPASSGTTALKVLSWNMAHEKLPSADLQKFLETFKPDVAGLVEVGARHGDPNPLVANLPAGYIEQKLDHSMAIIVRGTVRLLHQVLLGKISKFASLEAVIDGVTWHVFIVDGASGPTASREDVLARVLTEARGKPHTVIVGDFNTPVESAFFDPWRAELHHAFDETGSGFRETWPRWIPVLTIDHVWSSHDAPPRRAEKRWLPSSDHAGLLVELGRK